MRLSLPSLYPQYYVNSVHPTSLSAFSLTTLEEPVKNFLKKLSIRLLRS